MALSAKQTAQIIRRMILSTALVLGLPGDFRGAAAQSCAVQAPRYNLSADTVDWSMKIASGRSCVRGLRFRGFDIESVKLVARPQFGQVTVQGPGFQYTSKPNYNGPDSFSLAVLGRSDKQRGSSTIRVKVSVGESIATKDVTSPSIAFIMPSNGSTLSGSVTLTATASDDVAVANVQFFVDGVAIGSPVAASPYTTTWDCTAMADGPHLLDAVAQDTSGNHATSSINIMVDNIGP